MNLFLLLVLAVVLMYGTLSVLIVLGWYRGEKSIAKKISGITKISVVVACRNEEENMENLFTSLSLQTYPKDLWEIIIANDHSEDKTVSQAMHFANMYGIVLKVVTCGEEEFSKKTALDKAIQYSRSELIVTSDADCLFHPEWLSSIESYYANTGSDMICGPVGIKPKDYLFEKMQALEYSGIAGSGVAFFNWNKPIMSNGANLAFRKTAYQQVGGYSSHLHIASGDDVLLMQSFLKSGLKVKALTLPQNLVLTKAESDFYGFINQRIRWASKNMLYVEPITVITGLVVSLMYLSIIGSILYSLFHANFFWIAFSLFLYKSTIDVLVLTTFSGFFNTKKLLSLLLPTQAFALVYTCIVVAVMPFYKYSWKGRTTTSKNNK